MFFLMQNICKTFFCSCHAAWLPCKTSIIEGRVRKQSNCPSFSNKSTLSRIPKEQATFVSTYAGSMPVSMKYASCGLRDAGCGMRTADCGVGIEHGLRNKTRTKHYRLSLKHSLRAGSLVWATTAAGVLF